MESWKPPFILMVDRGACTFVNKVRNAQHAGAAAVVIADTTCLCTAGEACVNEDGMAGCETKEPVMADDGSGSDITIPSFLMFKQDADPIKEAIKKNTVVRMELSWALPRPDAKVEYSLWTTPKDPVSYSLLKTFREVARALGDHAQFTPHMYIYDGVFAGCMDSDGKNECYSLCTNDGRYCATDPDDNLDKGISGADVVTESLRRLCIWQEYGKDGVGMPWWDYIDEFLHRCDVEKYFTNQDCIKDAMIHAGIDFDNVNQCMADSGGLEDGKNKIIEDELDAREQAGVVIMPSFFVNSAPLRGALTTGEVFEAICAGYAAGSEPEVCTNCRLCDDLLNCVAIGHCPGAKGSLDQVSVPVFGGSMLTVVFCFSTLGFIQWRRAQTQMNAEVRAIMAEYMPVDKMQNVESLGIPDGPDDDDLQFEIS
jgi:hypothetical protein